MLKKDRQRYFAQYVVYSCFSCSRFLILLDDLTGQLEFVMIKSSKIIEEVSRAFLTNGGGLRVKYQCSEKLIHRMVCEPDFSISEGTIIYKSSNGVCCSAISYWGMVRPATYETQSGISKRNRLRRLSVVNDPPSSPEITTARGVALIKLGPITHFIN